METDVMEIDLSKYLDIVRRWLWLLILGPLLVGAMALAVSFLLPSQYEAEADVASVRSFSQISFSPDYKTLSEAQLTQGLDVAARQKALIAIARGNEIATEVVHELGPSLQPEQRDIARLVESVNVSADGDLIRIKVQNRDPQMAARIANAWARSYVNHVNQLYTEIPNSLDQIQSQSSLALQNYQVAESALGQFVGNNQIDSISREIAAKKNTLNDLYATQRSLDRLLQDTQSFQDLLDKDPSASIDDLNNRVAALLIRSNAALLSYMGPSNSASSVSNLPSSASNLPSSTSNSASSVSNSASPASSPIAFPPNQSSLPLQIQVTSASLGNSTPSGIRMQAEALVAALQARKKQVESQVADPALPSQILGLQKQLEQQTAKQQELMAARDLTWSTYKTIASKVEEVRMAQQSSGTIVRVASSAVVPSQPVAPRKTTNALLAAIVGFILSLGIAFSAEYFNSSLRSTKDIVQDLGVPVYRFGPNEIEAIGPSSKGPTSTSWSVPNNYYRLWANLFLGSQAPSKTILFTSPDQVEGQDWVAANLGVVAAQSGRRVILVDTDVSNPMLDRIFGLPNAQGWSSVLAEAPASLENCLQSTSVKNLSVLTSGPALGRFDEAMVSLRLASVLDGLKEKADLVILTSAPFPKEADALFISRCVESVLLLATLGLTHRESAIQSKEQLLNVNAKIIGVILLPELRAPLTSLGLGNNTGLSIQNGKGSVRKSLFNALRERLALAFRFR